VNATTNIKVNDIFFHSFSNIDKTEKFCSKQKHKKKQRKTTEKTTTKTKNRNVIHVFGYSYPTLTNNISIKLFRGLF
jgi:hypothetical protein